MHWQNTGLDFVTSSSAILQIWFGAGPFWFELSRKFQHHVSRYHQRWSDQQQIPRTVANAKRCAIYFLSCINS